MSHSAPDTTLPIRQELGAIANHQRRQAQLAWRLERLPYDEAMQLLIASLGDPYPLIRQWSASQLGQRLDEKYSERVRSLFLEPEEEQPAWMPRPGVRVWQAGLVALKHVPGPKTEEVMVRFSEHPDADIRYQAMVGLFAVDAQDERLEPVVRRALGQERDVEVVMVAGQIAAERGWGACLGEMWRRYREAHGEEKFQMAMGIVSLEQGLAGWEHEAEGLFELFESHMSKEETVVAAAKGLGRLASMVGGEVRAAKGLSKVLDRWLLHPILKVDVAAQLALLGDPKGLEYLSKVIEGKRKDAKGHAIDLAGRMGFQALYGPIARIAKGTEYHNDVALMALGNYGTPEAKALLGEVAVGHQDQEMRELAAKVLAHQGDGPVSFFEV